MYVSVFAADMPTGRGFEWVKEPTSNKFFSRLIAAKGVSKACVQWMDYVNATDDRFVDESGVRQSIIHGWNATEVKIGNYPVDGYVKVDNKVYILQFDGCQFVSELYLNV